MKRTLHLAITSGDETCASAPGVWCRYQGATHFGTRPVCLLFRGEEWEPAELHEVAAGPRKGWLARLAKCIEAEGAR